MKYCLRCARIIADNSMFKDMDVCNECNIPFEKDDMTGEMFESLSETEKQNYANNLFAKIRKSSLFDEKMFDSNLKSYGEANLYASWWYDKAERLGARFVYRYETDEQRKRRLDEQFGSHSPAYQKAVLEQCIQADRERKAANSNTPKCPTCGSTSIEKISLGKKAFGGAMFGIFSSNVRNTFHCKNCGYKW